MTTSIVCVDDNPLVAEALERRLAMEPDFEWRGWLARSDAIATKLAELNADIVLLDIDVPGLDAFGLVEQLATELPDTRVIMFTGHARPDYQEQALARGAWGFISKNVSTQGLVQALRQVARGEVALDQMD